MKINEKNESEPVSRAISKIAIVSPDQQENEGIDFLLQRLDFSNISTCPTIADIAPDCSVIILGNTFSIEDKLDAGWKLRQTFPVTPLFCCIDAGQLAQIPELFRSGFTDYLYSPICTEELSRKLDTQLVVAVLEQQFRASNVSDMELIMQRKLGKALATSNRILEDQVKERTFELQTMASDLETRLDRDRERIARDLHDEFGQLLSCLRFEVELVDSGPAESEDRLARIEACHVIIDKMLQSSRRIVRGLRPAALENGLVSAIKELALETGERYSLAVECTIPPQLAVIDPSTSLDIYRIVQEAINNAVKHAKADNVSVHGSIGGGLLEMTIVDDGQGFESEHSKPGFGLINMRERARSLNGELLVSHVVPAGTEIKLVLPFSK